MKKNGLQLLSLLLSVVLLVMLFWQMRAVEDLRHPLQNVENRMYDLEDEVRGISRDVIQAVEDAADPVLRWELQPVGIDREKRVLLAEASLELKNWREDTRVSLEALVGSDRQALSMTADEAGVCGGTVLLPVDESCEVKLAAVITGGGESQRVELGGWGDLSMLLPLQSGGGGWEGPVYRDGILSSQFHITIEGRDNRRPGAIEKPEFRIYRNGELVQTFGAVIDPSAGSGSGVCYTVDTEDYRWGLECDEGDIIEIRFLCQDEYGLGYDFLFAVWTPDGETPENQMAAGMSTGSGELRLYWPE